MPQPKVFIFDWDADRAHRHAEQLQAARYQVRTEDADAGRGLASIREDLPDAVVFDLDTDPDQCRAVAQRLHSEKPTRALPLLFMGGRRDDREKTRAEVTNASFTDPGTLQDTLDRMLRPAE